MNKIIFLDRDGTINEDVGYLSDAKDFKFLPNAVEGLQLMQEKGYKLNIVTNQSGIGRKMYSLEDYNKVNDFMIKQLEKSNVYIDNVFYCPHRPEIYCKCRKPKTGMVKRYMVKKSRKDCYVIGDKTSDLRFGELLKIKTTLVLTGEAGRDKLHKTIPNYVVDDLLDFAKNILI